MKTAENYVIRDRESGNIISTFETIEEAERCLQVYEQADKRDGIYTPDFYEIAKSDAEN